MDKIKSHLSCIKLPKGGDKIYKDECMYSFDTPESVTGLYVCLKTFMGFGKDYVPKYSDASGNKLFLHLLHTKNEILTSDAEPEPEKKIAKLAIGVEGGFNPSLGKKKYTVEKQHSIVILPDWDTIPLPNAELPDIVQLSVTGILNAESAFKLAELESAAQSWDGEVRQVSQHAANLVQLNNGVKIPPSGWQCSKCDKTGNLWLNLTDGMILCGRRQYDGSGGNDHAIHHYQNTGFPLAVKLGTITPDGQGDVFSYPEEEMMIDPHLKKHLEHFGLEVSTLEKTDKTMLELEIDYNQRAWEWSRMTESGAKLLPKFGPGYTGLQNLGNSCYLNSVMQVLITLPSFKSRFYDCASNIFDRCPASDIPNDFNAQLAKLIQGLLSGNYSKSPTEPLPEEIEIDSLQPGVSPVGFRTLVGRHHPEFSTKKQQDAVEFFEHVLKLVTRNACGEFDPGHSFRFKIEDKFICSESGCVKYVNREHLYLPLPVPTSAATNLQEVELSKKKKEDATQNNQPCEEPLSLKIPFGACLSTFAASEQVEDVYSTAVKKMVNMQKITRFTTFPDYLLIQLVKFCWNEQRQPEKYDVSIDMPDVLDLSVLKACGQQPGENIMPDELAQAQKSPALDESVVAQLVEMGFPSQACQKAVHLTGNSGTEAAMNWIMEHMADADFADPLSDQQTQGSGRGLDSFAADENGIAMLMSMGFTRDQALLSLKETDNNLERAADWIFSHQPQLDDLVQRAKGQAGAAMATESQTLPLTDGQPIYELAAFISHMGKSIFVGHYVCHIKKDGEWTIFNDNKVCKSENPPKDLGYIYLYKRKDQ